jgi:glycosyltransferase involved in cell wall biosynthesis
MSLPKFSVIIPTYNAGETISETLSSIVAQTFKKFEIVIIDGLSSDSTISIVSKFADNDGRIAFKSERDLGIYDAMNKGILRSRGDWILFCGADDRLYDENVLEDVWNELDKNSASFVYGNVIVDGDTQWASKGELYDGEFDLKKLVKKNICHQAIFYKKEIFGRLGYFDTHFKICADWDFNLRCFALERVAYIQKTIAIYSANGVSSRREDLAFSKVRIARIAKYFQNRLYDDLFIEDRYAIRKLIFDKKSDFSLLERIKISFFVIILQSKAWLKRVSAFKSQNLIVL